MATSTEFTKAHKFYIQVLDNDPPQKKYADATYGNYKQLIADAFAYAQNLQLPRPYYCKYGVKKNKNQPYVYAYLVANTDIKPEEVADYAADEKLANSYGFHFEKKKNISGGFQDNYTEL